MAFTYKKKNITQNSQSEKQEREPSEYDGIYINIGIPIVIGNEGEEEEAFARLPHRAIALADLELFQVTERTRKNNPRWAAQADEINGVINAMRKGGLSLEEGEGSPLRLAMQIFRAEPKSDEDPVTPVEIKVSDIMG